MIHHKVNLNLITLLILIFSSNLCYSYSVRITDEIQLVKGESSLSDSDYYRIVLPLTILMGICLFFACCMAGLYVRESCRYYHDSEERYRLTQREELTNRNDDDV